MERPTVSTIMNVAQRRGKATEKATTVLVAEGEEAKGESRAATTPVRVAKVRRNFCGTGPFDKHWLNLDCCGIVCAFFTYFLHAYGVYAVNWVLLPPWMSYTIDDGRSLSFFGMIHSLGFLTVSFMAVASHFQAMTTDPGSVPPDAKPLHQQPKEESGEMQSLLEPISTPPVKRLCRRCKTFKPQRAHHCSVCKRCIIKMDHHCPWVNNCVGIGNHKYFLLFVFYTFLSCCYSLTLIISRFSSCGLAPIHPKRMAAARLSKSPPCLDHPAQLLTILFLLIEAILFGIFTSCMMFDQADVIRSKVTHIDRLTGSDVSGSLAGVLEVFGVLHNEVSNTRMRTDWFSPFARVCLPCRDEVMGFCRPCPKDLQDSPQSTKKKTDKALPLAEIV